MSPGCLSLSLLKRHLRQVRWALLWVSSYKIFTVPSIETGINKRFYLQAVHCFLLHNLLVFITSDCREHFLILPLAGIQTRDPRLVPTNSASSLG